MKSTKWQKAGRYEHGIAQRKAKWFSQISAERKWTVIGVEVEVNAMLREAWILGYESRAREPK